MENKIIINNPNILNYVMFKLDKITNEFTKDELAYIKEIVIEYNQEFTSNSSFYEELLKFSTLSSLTIRNGYIFNIDYNYLLKLHNLIEIVFDNCEFENADLITSLDLKSLSLINCKINNYSFIITFNNLKSLTIINGKVTIDKINNINNLTYLQLSHSNILDKTNTINIASLTELHIDNTNINNLDFINNLPNLKKMSIDKFQYINNKDIIDNITNKKITILSTTGVDKYEV